MRALALGLGLALVLPSTLPSTAQADDALPPPQVIRRSSGAKAPTPAPQAAPGGAPVRPAPVFTAPGGRPLVVLPPPVAPRGGLRGTSSATLLQPAPRLVGPGDAPSQLEIQRQVDSYLGGAMPLVSPNSGAGSAGYEKGFIIRGGDTSLRINLLLQTRYEAFEWDELSPVPGGDRSGFSVPRAVLRLSGEAPCSMRYFLEMDFGHNGAALATSQVLGCGVCRPNNLGPDTQANNWSRLREAWIEWNGNSYFNVRAGSVGLPTTRQLMTRPEMTQFVDISLASAWTGLGMPGYTDRNRDFGVLLHGALGANKSLEYMLSVTNGDGADGIRNVTDGRSSDNLAYGGRVNWIFAQPQGYEEGALRQLTGRLHGEVGAWAFYYADRADQPHAQLGDYLRYGIDAAVGIDGWSFTGALTFTDDQDVLGVNDDESTAWLVQAGHHFRGTPFEVAARWSGYDTKGDLSGNGVAQEIGVGVNYYLNGHGNKLQLDAAWVDTSADGFLILDAYAGYPAFLAQGNSGWLLRFQWQLAL